MSDLIIPFRRRQSPPDAGLRVLFKKHLPQFDWCPVESGATGRGIPDLNGCCAGVEVWLELKACDHWRVSIRKEQIAWTLRRIDHGGRVFIAVRRAQHELWLFHGDRIESLASQRINTILYQGIWNGGPARWDWERVREILLK